MANDPKNPTGNGAPKAAAKAAGDPFVVNAGTLTVPDGKPIEGKPPKTKDLVVGDPIPDNAFDADETEKLVTSGKIIRASMLSATRADAMTIGRLREELDKANERNLQLEGRVRELEDEVTNLKTAAGGAPAPVVNPPQA